MCLPAGDAYGEGEAVAAVVTVENVGERPAAEVVQLYVAPVRGARPCGWELVAFAKVSMEPGDVVDVHLEVPPSVLQIGPEAGSAQFHIRVGPCCSDVCFEKRITVS